MSSEQKTSTLGLSKYQGDEHLLREDFNSDLEKIDTAISEMTTPIDTTINDKTISFNTTSNLKKVTLKIAADVTGGPVFISRNGQTAKPLKLPNDEAVTELLAETMFYDVVEEAEAFIYAPKTGAKKFYGDGSDGELNTSGYTNLSTTLNGKAVIKQYTNIKINSGHTVTTNYPCQGLILYATGNVVIDGTLSMNQKAACITSSAAGSLAKYGQCELTTKIITKLMTMEGGSGGNGGYGGGSGSSGSYRSSGGIGGDGRLLQGGFGGGGGGGAIFTGNTFISGQNGGSLSHPEIGCGKGVSVFTNKRGTGLDGSSSTVYSEASAGAGGAGTNDINSSARSGKAGDCNGAGSGGTGGAWRTNGINSSNSNYAGGFICIIAKGEVIINGTITSNGGTGGVGTKGINSGGSGGGGGGAGGGVIAIFHNGLFTNNGTITVEGGNGGESTLGGQEIGGTGTAGSVGTISINRISDL